MIILNLKRLYYKRFFSETTIFENLKLSLFKDYQTLAIFGANGFGKSTLVNLLFSNINVLKYNGEITYKNNNIKYSRSNFLDLGFINSIEAELEYPNITLRNLILMNKLHNLTFDKQIFESLYKILELPDRSTNFNSLSSGQKRKFHLALGVSNWNEYNIFDEVLANIDPETSNFFLETIINIQKEKKGRIIFITHIPFEAMFCEKCLFILKNQGRKVLKILSIKKLQKLKYFKNSRPEFIRISNTTFLAPNKYTVKAKDIICDSELGALEIIKHYYKHKTLPKEVFTIEENYKI